MNSTTSLKRDVVAYLAIAYALATAIVVALPHANINRMFTILVPVISVTIVTFTVTPRGSRKALWAGLGLRRAGFGVWGSALVIPVLLALGAYGAAAALGAGRVEVDLAGADLNWTTNLLISLVMGTVFIMGEEIGWRGFLLPRIQQLVPDRRRAALVTGFFHGCFHLPLIVLGTTYDHEIPAWIAAPSAVVLITAGGVFYAWLRDRSGSAWPAAIAHNAVNTAFDLGSVAVVATGGANIAYIAGETGVATVGVAIVTAVVLWRYARVWRTPAPLVERQPVAVAAA